MTQQPEDWLRQQFSAKFEEESRSIGRFNLAIFGKTGVGKSTLINAIFGEEVAATGIGAPITQGSHLYLHVSGHFGVLDTRGLEIGKDSATILRELEQYVQEMRRKPLAEQVHVVWYCVRAADRRFEDTEAEFIRALHRLGLQELLDATFRVAPQGVAAALTAAQKIDMGRKRAAANKAIGVAVTAAGAAGATPIPFSDAVILVPIQLSMMARISHIYDIKVDKATTAALAATAAATAGGRSLATGLIKLVPGVGAVVGGAIAA